MSDTNELTNDRDQQATYIRGYLLGDLSDEAKMREIEEKLLVDDTFAEELSLVEDDLVEEYLDDRLSQHERARFEQVLRVSAERLSKVQLISNLRKYAAERTRTTPAETKRFDWRSLFRMPMLGFAGAAVVIAALAIALIVNRPTADSYQGIAALQAAYAGKRPFESRLTFETGYSAYSTVRGAPQSDIDADALLKAKALLLNAKVNSPSDPAVGHALGVLYLAEKRYAEAASELEKALGASPRNARLLNDLASLYLERTDTTAGERIKGQALAIDYLNRALEIDATLNVAAFNRAVALQRMKLDNEARQAWEEYLKRDPSSEWANEARRNLELLGTSQSKLPDKANVVADFLVAFRQQDDEKALSIARETKELITGFMVQSQLVNGVLAVAEDPSGATRSENLSALRYLGRIEKEHNSDLFFADHAEFLTRADAQVAELRIANAIVEAAYDHLGKPNWSEALSSFEEAAKIFRRVGNAWEADLAEYQVCYILAQLNRLDESNNRLLALHAASNRRSYKWLAGISAVLIGSNHSLLGLHSRAIEFDKKALEIAGAIGDAITSQKAANQLTHEYYSLGDEARSFSTIAEYMHGKPAYFQSPRQQSRNLLFATQALYSFAMYAAAEAFAKEQLHLASVTLKNPWLRHSAHIHLAIILSAAGQHDIALDEIRKCFDIVNSFRDEAMREKQRIRTTLILARIQRDADRCPEATENYRDVISRYENSEFQMSLYEARKGRLICSIKQADDVSVKAQIPEVISLFDRNRQAIEDGTDRNVFFDREQDVYDIATDYTHVRLKDPRQAFDYAENSKARSLLRSLASGEAKPLTSHAVQNQLPPDVEVIYYALLRDRLLVWRLSSSAFDVVDVPVPAEQLQRMVRQFTDDVISKRDSAALGAELHKVLLDPIIGLVGPGKTLCIVADKILFKLPFAALRSPSTGEYLIQKFPLVYAPSATLFVHGSTTARSKASTGDERFLGIGNPSLSDGKYPGLADLPDAVLEVKKAAEFYQGPKILETYQATRSAFLAELASSDVVHFAGHYVVDVKSPTNSRLLTANGELPISDLLALDSIRPRLVILSACDSGVEGYLGGEGFFGASRAFLGAGVPVVVGTQWAVDSAAMNELMTSFHRHRKSAGATTSESVRRAQLDMLASARTDFHIPYFWAGVMAIGGYSEY